MTATPRKAREIDRGTATGPAGVDGVVHLAIFVADGLGAQIAARAVGVIGADEVAKWVTLVSLSWLAELVS